MTRVRHSRGIGVYGAPIVVGLLSLGGLLSALLLGEFGRYLAWCALGAPPAIAAWAFYRS